MLTPQKQKPGPFLEFLMAMILKYCFENRMRNIFR